MKDATNAINTMLYLQKADAPTPDTTAKPIHSLTWDYEEQNAEFEESAAHEKQALSTINRCVKFFGDAATKELEEHMELLQETFIAHLESVLQKHEIVIQEKLTLSLSASDTLILQCQGQEEDLLNALGDDATLLYYLKELRKIALVGRGLDYILAVQADYNNDEYLPQYKVCTKGALSHFYFTTR